ncbi:MAG: A/G-specific adenine glycosylase [Sandaracinaceae bacterium]|nr:A/G-specific adenine glycosylase [Sandaracinaceae bacterium]
MAGGRRDRARRHRPDRDRGPVRGLREALRGRGEQRAATRDGGADAARPGRADGPERPRGRGAHARESAPRRRALSRGFGRGAAADVPVRGGARAGAARRHRPAPPPRGARSRSAAAADEPGAREHARPAPADRSPRARDPGAVPPRRRRARGRHRARARSRARPAAGAPDADGRLARDRDRRGRPGHRALRHHALRPRHGLRDRLAVKAPASTRAALVAWYDAEKRSLPWRETRDPYAIWVSEIMLQQTRVDTVIPYFERFLERFPSPRALAEASEDEVLGAWSGLGYYRRARWLHAGVREVVARYGGEVPEDPEARRALPGVGRYTAGAIGSIAFGKAEPVVDGNVARVLARLHGIATPLGRADTERALWSRAEALVEGPRPGDLNQAVMELGATVCSPRAPRCEACPVASECVARRDGRTAELPAPKARKKPVDAPRVAVVATRRGAVALVKRDGPLFGGLWELPLAEGAGRTAAREALREAGVSARIGEEPVAALEHVLSHRRLLVEVWRATAAKAPDARWVEPAELGEVGTSTLTRRCVEQALGAA